MRLSVLDVLPTGADVSTVETFKRTKSLAQHVDALGYHRLWFAEHHGLGMIASSAPEILIAHIAPFTESIRIGAGGVMLPNHAPLRVVEQYRTLEALHPGRIDLGIGRAAGTDPLTSRALAAQPGVEFSDLFQELMSFSEGSFSKRHPYRRIKVTPQGVPLPPIWMLGSSGGSAQLAGEVGAGYAFAAHFSPIDPLPAVSLYKEHFRPSSYFEEPEVIVAASVICAEDPDHARAHCVILAAGMQSAMMGIEVPVPSFEEALANDWSEQELRMRLGPVGTQMIYGSPAQVQTKLERVVERAQADELMVMTVIHDHEARLESYRLLAALYGVD